MKGKYTEIEKCRISGSKNLVTVLSLGYSLSKMMMRNFR